MAILQNQEDFKKMLSNEGVIEASAAERGVRGASVRRQLVMNQGEFGISQAMRSRALATARFDAKEAMADTNRQLKVLLIDPLVKLLLHLYKTLYLQHHKCRT